MPIPSPTSATQRRFDALAGVGAPAWVYGATRWAIAKGNNPGDGSDAKCRAALLPSRNWPDELHEDTIEGGEHHNSPRYYIKNRQTVDQRVQYIASHKPIAKGLQNDEDVSRDPDPVPGKPNTFNDVEGRVQYGSTVCHDSTIENVQITKFKNSNQVVYPKIMKDCDIIPTLVKLCMDDPRVVLAGSFDRIVRAAFNYDIPSINEGAAPIMRLRFEKNVVNLLK